MWKRTKEALLRHLDSSTSDRKIVDRLERDGMPAAAVEKALKDKGAPDHEVMGVLALRDAEEQIIALKAELDEKDRVRITAEQKNADLTSKLAAAEGAKAQAEAAREEAQNNLRLVDETVRAPLEENLRTARLANEGLEQEKQQLTSKVTELQGLLCEQQNENERLERDLETAQKSSGLFGWRKHKEETVDHNVDQHRTETAPASAAPPAQSARTERVETRTSESHGGSGWAWAFALLALIVGGVLGWKYLSQRPKIVEVPKTTSPAAEPAPKAPADEQKQAKKEAPEHPQSTSDCDGLDQGDFFVCCGRIEDEESRSSCRHAGVVELSRLRGYSAREEGGQPAKKLSAKKPAAVAAAK